MQTFLIASFLFLSAVTANAVPSSFVGLDLRNQKQISLDIKNKTQKAVVVIFMSSKCPCSNSHVLEVKSLAEKYKDFAFVGIHANADEDIESSTRYFQNINFPFPVLQDVKAAYADDLKANKTPHAFVISNEGTILYRGGVTNSSNAPQASRFYLREVLEDIVNNKPLRQSETRTLGCAISREGQSGWQ